MLCEFGGREEWALKKEDQEGILHPAAEAEGTAQSHGRMQSLWKWVMKMTEEKMLQECRRTVLRLADAVRALDEDVVIPWATVRRSPMVGGVRVEQGIERLARSVGKTLDRSRRYEDGAPLAAEEEWFTYRGVRFYRQLSHWEINGRKRAVR